MPVRSDVDATVIVTNSITARTVATNTTVNGSSVDMASYAGYKLLAVCETGSRTDGTYTFKLQDSADNSSFADVAVFSGTIGAISAADTVNKSALAAVRRYVRVVCTSTVVTTGAIVSAKLIAIPRVI